MINIAKTKICNKCKQEFPNTTEYFFRNCKSNDGLVWSCKPCSMAQNKLVYAKYKHKRKLYYDKHHKKPKTRYGNLKHSSKLRGIEFNLNFSDYNNLIKLPCYYCNNLFHKNIVGSGLDRIDSSKGYERENVVSCCKICNMLKGYYFTKEETAIAVAAIIKYRKTGNDR